MARLDDKCALYGAISALGFCTWVALAAPNSVRGEAGSSAAVDDEVRLLAADPLELAAFAARRGDDQVLAMLRTEADPARTFVAVGAAPYLRCPVPALPPLAVLASGRDPDLSEAAARRARLIAQAFAVHPGPACEEERDATHAARAAWNGLASDTTMRMDLRQLAAEVAVLLGGAVAPASK